MPLTVPMFLTMSMMPAEGQYTTCTCFSKSRELEKSEVSPSSFFSPTQVPLGCLSHSSIYCLSGRCLTDELTVPGSNWVSDMPFGLKREAIRVLDKTFSGGECTEASSSSTEFTSFSLLVSRERRKRCFTASAPHGSHLRCTVVAGSSKSGAALG